ncbi:hypothetical protein DBR40_07260 [Pedobacter sp. KBW01]|uniref:GTPase domain-containing protein n=1 Tax=Pedobacter sp. KBW01 TaxID=2153364 RepID=UPI000F5A96D7|nr:GTPase domain-containing protein [Pedobacter sp. KBW01]RQO77766.1 hypothetical protein DBR40_07260 [Pedobacter sp. KBW01]
MDENQIRKILSKAKELNIVIDQDLATKALEINSLAASAERKKLLNRLISSLEQYIAKEQNLVYIGFVGHFSSGKSSTINSILKISDTPDERHTDQNPTDTTITLITDKSNSHKVMHMTKESTLVPVRTFLIESVYLQNVVVADTPGSGDPNIANELIQDFLPICDYILYFISAANPIDQADIPLLMQKNIKLPFIPLKFVVTRSNEFCKVGGTAVSSENIDDSKRDNFTGQLISRLKEFAKTDELTVDDFIFIDNRDKYNIDELGSKISSWSSALDQTAIWNNHSHKIDFYSGNLNELEQYFLKTISDKIRITADFLTTAGENIHKFDAAVEVNNEKLRSVWIDSERKLKKSSQTEIEQLDYLIKARIPVVLFNSEQMASEQRIINSFIENQSNGNIGQFASVLYQQVRSRITVVKQDLENALENEDILIEDIRNVLPPRIELSTIEEKVGVDFSKMDAQVISYLNRLYNLADGFRLALISRIEMFLTALNQKPVVNTLENIYKHGGETISENFDKYFDVIEMYKASVLTKNTKDTIQKLRIGKQLDELDDEFPEEYKQTKKEEAIDSIYPKKEDKIAELRVAVHEIEDQVLALKRELSSEQIKRDSTLNTFFEKEEFKITDIMEEAKNSIEKEVNRIYQEKLLKVFEDHRKEYLVYLERKEKQNKIRIWAIAKWTLIAAVLGALFAVALFKLKMVTPASVIWTIGIGLGTSFIWAVLAYIIAIFKNDLTTLTEKHNRAFREKSIQRIKSDFNEDFFNGISQAINEARPKKLPSLESIYLKKIGEVTGAGNLEVQQLLADLNNQNDKLISEIIKYNQLVSGFQQSFNGIFSNLDENILKIRLITQQIKQKSIEPSFALLENTQIDLKNVKVQIESIVTGTEVVESAMIG